jgi:hypothetical protein
MTDRPATDDADARPAEAPRPEPDLSLPALELRVRRLEDAFAAIQDTTQMEDRVVRRLADRLSRNGGDALPTTTDVIIDGGRPLLPIPVAVLPSPDRPAPEPPRRSWLLIEALAELRSIWRMYVDPRYRLTWEGKLFPLLIVALMAASWFMIGSLPVIGSLLDRAVMLVLAFFLYKVLGREARRYQAMVPDPTGKGRV